MKNLDFRLNEWLVPECDKTRGFENVVALLDTEYKGETISVEVDLTCGINRSSLSDDVRVLEEDEFTSEELEEIQKQAINFAEKEFKEYKEETFKPLTKEEARKVILENNITLESDLDEFIEDNEFYQDVDLLLACNTNDKYLNEDATPYANKYYDIQSFTLEEF